MYQQGAVRRSVRWLPDRENIPNKDITGNTNEK
jgi:hypothetical protein